ncbi:hypothetical protein OAV51_00475 [Flavobacteriaceae bacterium]|nr:hypothetical protein [Flavobacteriaceae bacterium]
MKKLLLLLLLFTIPVISFSQEIDYGNSSEAANLCVDLKSNSFSSNYDADEALNKILSVVGAAKRFMLVPCENINNAVAYTSESGLRYIIYDEVFMNSLSTGDNYWGNMAILAHEVGHHINGHTLAGDLSQYESRLEELEADEFAGFVLSKLGAKLDEVKSVFSEISFDGDDTYSSHPNRSRRLNAVEKGFEKAINNDNITQKKLSTFEEYFYRGNDNINNENYSKAIVDYDEAIKLRKDYVAFFNRGMSKWYLDDIPGALSDLYKSLELQPNYIYALNLYADIEYDKYTTTSMFSSISYRLRELNNLSADSPDRVMSNYYLGDAYRFVGLNNKALEALMYADKNSKGELKDKDSDIDLAIGKTYAAMDSLDLANKYFESAIKLYSKNYYTFYSIAYTLDNDLDNPKEAIKYYDRSIELNPSFIGSYKDRAAAYSKLALSNKDYYYQAIFDITKAIEINGDLGYYYFKRGNYKNSLGIDGDCEDWLKAMDLNYSNDAIIKNLVGYCGYTEEDFYSNSDWYSLAGTEFNNGNYLKAIEYYDKSILLPGVDDDDYFYRGLAYFRINKYEQALKDYYKASELDPGVRQDFRIVQTLIAIERFDEAIELFEKDTNETLLTNLYLDETKKEFDTKHIIEFTDYYYEVSKIRDLILEKTGSSNKERLKYLDIMEDAYIQSFPESSNIVLYLTLNTLDIEDLIEDKFSYIIKLNTIIDLIKNTEIKYSNSVAILFEKRGDLKIDIGDKLGACKDYESGLKIIDDEYKNIADRLKEKQLKNCN